MLNKFFRTILFLSVLSLPLYAQDSATDTTVAEQAQEGNAKQTEKQKAQEKKQGNQEEQEFSRYFDEQYKSDPTKNIQKGKRVSWVWQLVKTSFGLLLIIGFFYMLVRLYRFQQNLPTRYSQVIKSLHQHPLAGGKQIQILELGKRLLVVAVSDAGVQLLTEIHEKSEIDKIKLESSQYEDTSPPDFLTELTKTLKQEWGKTKNSFGKDGSKKSFSNFADMQDDVSVNWNAMRKTSQDKLNHLKQTRENFHKGEESP